MTQEERIKNLAKTVKECMHEIDKLKDLLINGYDICNNESCNDRLVPEGWGKQTEHDGFICEQCLNDGWGQ